MRSLSESLGLLLRSEKALTIQRTDEGFLIAFSEMEETDMESLIFVVERALYSEKPLDEALEIFHCHYEMSRLREYNA